MHIILTIYRFNQTAYTMTIATLALYIMSIIGVKGSVGGVWDSSLRQCANCLIFKWAQLADLGTLRRCSSCKVLLYCDKECQKEHWTLVHRHHCKALAKAKADERTNSSFSGSSVVTIYSHHPFPLEGLPGDLQVESGQATGRIGIAM